MLDGEEHIISPSSSACLLLPAGLSFFQGGNKLSCVQRAIYGSTGRVEEMVLCLLPAVDVVVSSFSYGLDPWL